MERKTTDQVNPPFAAVARRPAGGSVQAPSSHADSPLGEAHFAVLQRAAVVRRPLRNAVRVAYISAWTLLGIGLLSMIFVVVSPSLSGFLMTGAICLVGWREYEGARKLSRGDLSAPAMLAGNQLCLLGLIIVYCVVAMVTFSPAEFEGQMISPETRAMLSQTPNLQGDIEGLTQSLGTMLVYGIYAMYALVIVLSIAFQGGLALYYFTRKSIMERAGQQTPAWVERVFAELNV